MKQKNMNIEVHIRNTNERTQRNRRYIAYAVMMMILITCMLYGDYPPPKESQARIIEPTELMASTEKIAPEISEEKERKGEGFVSTFSMTARKECRIVGDKDFDIAKKKKSGSKTKKKSVPAIKKYRYNCSETEYKVLLNIVEAEVTGNNPKGVGYEKAVECKLHVAQVILNRVEDDEFPDNIVDIVFARKQFSPTEDGRYGTLEITDATKEAVSKALNAETPDTTGGALYFAVPELTWYGLEYIKTDAVGHRLYRDITK